MEMCVFGSVRMARRSRTAPCQPINEVCKLSSLKKHSAGHTHTFINTVTHKHFLVSRQTLLFHVYHTRYTRWKSWVLLLFFSLYSRYSLLVWGFFCVLVLFCVRVCVSLSLFGQTVKDWFRVCCFEPTAKCCLANTPCSENKSFSRFPPTNRSSVSLSVSQWLCSSWLLFLSYTYLL